MYDTRELVHHTEEEAARLAERLLGALIGGAELLTIELGRRLGLYQALAELGPVGPARLARETGISERYAREWLEQQAAAGILLAEQEGSDGHIFVLPSVSAAVLADDEGELYFAGAAAMLSGAAATLDAVAAAFRSSGGVPYAQYGEAIRHGIASFNRAGFRSSMGAWLDQLPDIAAQLDAGAPILDAGCGVGWSSIALAARFPKSTVLGIDLDAASIREAEANARQAGVADRVTFRVADAAEELGAGAFALVTVFEALHDFGEPIRALAAFLPALAPGGAVLVGDEKVADEFRAPAAELDRMNYAFSVLHCLPSTMAESADVANGTVLRAPTVHRWAEEAGYRSVVLPIEHEFWRFYRLDPAHR